MSNGKTGHAEKYTVTTREISDVTRIVFASSEKEAMRLAEIGSGEKTERHLIAIDSLYTVAARID